MAEAATKLTVKTDERKCRRLLERGGRSKRCAAKSTSRQMEDFRRGPFGRRELTWTGIPAMDIVETEEGL